MKRDDFQAFVEALRGISEYYRRDPPGKFTVRLWWESLKGFELETVQKAFVAHVNRSDKEGQFMPSVSSLRQLIEGSVSDNATQAWTKVTKAVGQVGTGATVVFDDALIHRVIDDMGGWIALGQKRTDEWPFLAREFEGRYRAYRQRGDVPIYPPRLLGYFEATNGRNGHESDGPVMIGDVERARAVMSGGSRLSTLTFTAAAAVPALEHAA